MKKIKLEDVIYDLFYEQETSKSEKILSNEIIKIEKKLFKNLTKEEFKLYSEIETLNSKIEDNNIKRLIKFVIEFNKNLKLYNL